MPSYSLYNPSRYRAHLSSERKVEASMPNNQVVLNPAKRSKVIATDRNGIYLEEIIIIKHNFKERAKAWEELKAKYPDCYLFTHW